MDYPSVHITTNNSNNDGAHFQIKDNMTTQPGVVADGSRLQEGYRSKGRAEGRFQGARKRARG
jgi:hypothetical protein